MTAINRQYSAALVYVDAVQSVPHVATDVTTLVCDLLACSPVRPTSFSARIRACSGAARNCWSRSRRTRFVPAGTEAARRFETGTPSFEGQAGVLGTIDYLEWLGREIGPAANSRRSRLLAAMTPSAGYERELGERLLASLARVPGLQLYGPPTMDRRVPTFAFTLAGCDADAVARHLATRDIFAWSGHFTP